MTRASQLPVKRLPVRLDPDPGRVIVRQFVPGDQARIRDIIERALVLSEPEVDRIVVRLAESFVGRHRNLADTVVEHYDAVKHYVRDEASLSEGRRLLIGACFTMEYSIEAAALFNPSMVPADDQSGLPPGSTRFLMSLRAKATSRRSSFAAASSTPKTTSSSSPQVPSAGSWMWPRTSSTRRSSFGRS